MYDADMGSYGDWIFIPYNKTIWYCPKRGKYQEFCRYIFISINTWRYQSYNGKLNFIVYFGCDFGGCLVWLFAREATVHIGASGLIFGLVGFLIFNVFFRKDWRSLFVAIPIGFLYWTVIFGIFPSDPNISWEGHLFGLLTGVWLSYILRKSPAN